MSDPLTVGYMPGVGSVAPVGTHADFMPRLRAVGDEDAAEVAKPQVLTAALALWLGRPTTELGPDGRSFVHTFLPGGSIADLGPGWSNVESVEEADRRLRDEECRGRG